MNQQMRMARQFVDIQKIVFDGMVNNMIIFWDQTERMLGSFVDQAAWLPPEGKGAFKEWIQRNKHNCETFRNATKEGFTWLERFLSEGGKQQ